MAGLKGIATHAERLPRCLTCVSVDPRRATTASIQARQSLVIAVDTRLGGCAEHVVSSGPTQPNDRAEGEGVWLGGRESFRVFQETPMKTGDFRVNLMAPAIWLFRIPSDSFVCLRPFSDFPIAMTLEMTLDANHSGVLHV